MKAISSAILAICLLALCVSLTGPGLAQDVSGPEQAVKKFIKEFYSDNALGNFRSKTNAKKFFTPKTSKIVIAQSKKDIDADFIVEGQDFQLRNVSYSLSDAGDKKANVIVNFENFDKKIVNVFKMENVGGEWLIQDVCKRDKTCLLKL